MVCLRPHHLVSVNQVRLYVLVVENNILLILLLAGHLILLHSFCCLKSHRIGIGTMIMFQVVVNIFMTIGLGPVTGIPLPFLSYGRSAMVVNFIALGLCLSVVKQSKRLNLLR